MSDFPDYEAAYKRIQGLLLAVAGALLGIPSAVVEVEAGRPIPNGDDKKEIRAAVDTALGDEPLYRLVEDRVKCGEDCQSPHPQQRYVRMWPKEDNDEGD